MDHQYRHGKKFTIMDIWCYHPMIKTSGKYKANNEEILEKGREQ